MIKKEIREQERRIARAVAKTAEINAVQTKIFQKQKDVQSIFEEKQKTKMALIERRNELLRQMAEAEEQFEVEKAAQMEKEQAADQRRAQLELMTKLHQKTAAERLLAAKKLKAEKEESDAKARERLREIELQRTRKAVEIQKAKPVPEPIILESKKVGRGPKPEDFATTNFKITNGLNAYDSVTEDDMQFVPQPIAAQPPKVYSEEMLSRTKERAADHLKEFIRQREVEERQVAEKADKKARNLKDLRNAARKNRNLLVFKDEELTTIFTGFMSQTAPKFTKIDVESKGAVDFFWSDFPARKQFLQPAKSDPHDRNNDGKSVSFHYSVSEAGKNAEGQSSDESSFNQEIQYDSQKSENEKEVEERSVEEDKAPVDIKKFISEQEEFLRRLNQKNNNIKEEIQTYEYSDEEEVRKQEANAQKRVKKEIDFRDDDEEHLVAAPKKTLKLPPPKPKKQQQPRDSDVETTPTKKPEKKVTIAPSKDDIVHELKQNLYAKTQSQEPEQNPHINLYPEPDLEEVEDADFEGPIRISDQLKQKQKSSKKRLSSRRNRPLSEIKEMDEEESQQSHLFSQHQPSSSRPFENQPSESADSQTPPPQQSFSRQPKSTAHIKEIIRNYELSASEEEFNGEETPKFQIQKESKRKVELDAPDQKPSKSAEKQENPEQLSKSTANRSNSKNLDEMKKLRAKRMAYKPNPKADPPKSSKGPKSASSAEKKP